jgi:hypothetical protein
MKRASLQEEYTNLLKIARSDQSMELHSYFCLPRGCIFCHLRPFYERAVSDLDP